MQENKQEVKICLHCKMTEILHIVYLNIELAWCVSILEWFFGTLSGRLCRMYTGYGISSVHKIKTILKRRYFRNAEKKNFNISRKQKRQT